MNPSRKLYQTGRVLETVVNLCCILFNSMLWPKVIFLIYDNIQRYMGVSQNEVSFFGCKRSLEGIKGHLILIHHHTVIHIILLCSLKIRPARTCCTCWWPWFRCGIWLRGWGASFVFGAARFEHRVATYSVFWRKKRVQIPPAWEHHGSSPSLRVNTATLGGVGLIVGAQVSPIITNPNS